MINQADSTFKPGDGVRWRGRGIEGTVRRVQNLAGGIHYAVDFGAGRIQLVRQEDLEPPRPGPLQNLLEGYLEDAVDFGLRFQALRLTYAYASGGAVCLSNSRLEPQAHQVFVAHRAVQQLYPRVLLADEVGLGKTIEAGLILKELRARGLIRRALIITPANLVNQWCFELRSKFNEIFVPYSRARLNDLLGRQPDANPWEVEPNVICSRQLLARQPIDEHITRVDWDIAIVDEAHHVRRSRIGTKVETTLAYQLAQRLKTHALLLLTATPMQISEFEFYSLIELLDPALFPTYEDFHTYNNRTGSQINKTVLDLQRWAELDDRQRRAVAQACGHLLGASGHQGVDVTDDAIYEQLRTAVGIETYACRLMDLHRTGQVMIRNRKRVVGGFADRSASLIDIDMTPVEMELYQRVSAYVQEQYNLAQAEDNRALGFVMATYQRLLASSSYALAEALERRQHRLAELAGSGQLPIPPKQDSDESPDDELDDEALPSELEQLIIYRGDSWRSAVAKEIEILYELIGLARRIGQDSKLRQLRDTVSQLLRDAPNEKVIIFTTYRDTLEYVRRGLSDMFRVAVFHGGLDQRQKEDQVEQFRGTAPVMISTEAGGEGRNFQFCHLLFNYDLPWNPMRVEQRIGRIDRIGQTRQVHVYNFTTPQTIEGRIVERLHNRIHLFEQSVGGLDPILDGSIKREIEILSLRSSSTSDEELEAMADRITLQLERARQRENQLQDFVMGLNSFRRDEADRLLKREPEVTNEELQQFVMAALARFPQVTPPRRIGDKLWRINVPNVLNSQVRQMVYEPATFDPRIAVRNERVEFLAFGHPLVDALIDKWRDVRLRERATIRHLSDPELTDYEGLQVIFTVEYSGIQTVHRLHSVVVDRNLRCDTVLSHRITMAPDAPPPAEIRVPSAPQYRYGNPMQNVPFPGVWELGKLHDVPEDNDSTPVTKNGQPQARVARLGHDRVLLERCFDTAIATLRDWIQDEWAAVREESDRLYKQELHKVARIHDYRLARVNQDLQEAVSTLQRHESSPDPNERQIVPADRGRVNNIRAELARIEEEYDKECVALNQKREVFYALSVEAVAVVYGPSMQDDHASR